MTDLPEKLSVRRKPSDADRREGHQFSVRSLTAPATSRVSEVEAVFDSASSSGPLLEQAGKTLAAHLTTPALRQERNPSRPPQGVRVGPGAKWPSSQGMRVPVMPSKAGETSRVSFQNCFWEFGRREWNRRTAISLPRLPSSPPARSNQSAPAFPGRARVPAEPPGNRPTAPRSGPR